MAYDPDRPLRMRRYGRTGHGRVTGSGETYIEYDDGGRLIVPDGVRINPQAQAFYAGRNGPFDHQRYQADPDYRAGVDARISQHRSDQEYSARRRVDEWRKTVRSSRWSLRTGWWTVMWSAGFLVFDLVAGHWALAAFMLSVLAGMLVVLARRTVPTHNRAVDQLAEALHDQRVLETANEIRRLEHTLQPRMEWKPDSTPRGY